MRHKTCSESVVVLVLAVCCLTLTAPATGKEKVLYAFTGGADGAYPYGGLVFDSVGNLYGTANSGGTGSGCQFGCGAVYRLTRSGPKWSEQVLYSFNHDYDAAFPLYGVVLDNQGNIYGTAPNGGDPTTCYCGAVYELSPSVQGWKESVLKIFDYSTGEVPREVPTLDALGNIYGTTSGAGSQDAGDVFELSPSEGGGWNYSEIYAFVALRGGSTPYSGLTPDSSGNYYGTTSDGGSYGAGTVFELSPTASGWTETTLYHFTGGDDGGTPNSGVVFDRRGNLYGTTLLGGTSNVGVVYKLSRGKGNWSISVLYTFSGGNDGGSPGWGNVTLDPRGDLYGTTHYGGYFQYGTIYKLTAAPVGPWQETILHHFANGKDGGYPYAGVVLDGKGNVYGTTTTGGTYGAGVVYEIVP
jgi:uncharacterized repeat protein (TIGR03803 family)